MKRKFTKPQITNYSMPTADGQDSIMGQCLNGSFPESKPPAGACWAGTGVGESTNCVTGGFVGTNPDRNICDNGNGVIASNCVTGGIAG